MCRHLNSYRQTGNNVSNDFNVDQKVIQCEDGIHKLR